MDSLIPLDKIDAYPHIMLCHLRIPSVMPVLSPKLVDMIAAECLCARVQRASRLVGRRFDEQLRPFGLNNWQFTLLMTLNQPSPPSVNHLSELLGMDHTTTTKNLKPLEQRGLLAIRRDDDDARVRRIVLTDAGRAQLARAIPRWRVANDAIAAKLTAPQLAHLRSALEAVAKE